MRFETRYDRWLVIVLLLAATFSIVIFPAMRLFNLGIHRGPLWPSFLPWIVWLIVIPCTLPQYYEVREDELFLRQGWRRILIPYSQLIEIKSVSDATSAGVFSTQRLMVTTSANKLYIIAVADEDRFLEEVAKRCPQLTRQPFGLGLRFAS